MQLLFEWDENKAKRNLKKHKVSFEEVKTVFNDPLLITFPDEYHSQVEERFISIGLSAHHKLLLVVFIEQKVIEETVTIRIISCRKATAVERKSYEER